MGGCQAVLMVAFEDSSEDMTLSVSPTGGGIDDCEYVYSRRYDRDDRGHVGVKTDFTEIRTAPSCGEISDKAVKGFNLVRVV